MSLLRAIVRPPARTYPQALTRLVPPPPIDLSLALEQHRAYVEALRACDVDVIELPPDDAHPDSVFVQDPVLVVAGRAVVLRAAEASRAGEAEDLVGVLRDFVPVVEMEPPATLDGGDVLVAEGRLYVGISSRSNREGCDQLAALTGLPAVPVPLPEGLLHLLSGCTYLGRNRLLATPSLARRLPAFDDLLVPDAEAPAANVLVLGRHAIVPAGYPRVAALVAGCGLGVHAVPASEFEKRDGGVTCRALLF
jgi:dimethylargininase